MNFYILDISLEIVEAILYFYLLFPICQRRNFSKKQPANQGGREDPNDPAKQDVNTRLRTGFGLQTGQESQSLVNRARAALGIPVGGTRSGGG